ncbi:DNA adenine methylase [Qipengyuania flava]|nr:DNA adenine methylase [Qipengyuania flava]
MTYPGGKGRLWREIVSLMPPHEVYIETHLGGGSVLRNKRPARKSFAIDRDPTVLHEAKGWDLTGVDYILGKAEDFLTSYRFTGCELVYLDPPYLPSTRGNRRYYRHEYDEADHVRLLDLIDKIACPVLISGYEAELYSSRLSHWNKHTMTNVTHAGRRIEHVWANFDFQPYLHDYSVIGGDYRERDRIRRRAKRWTNRLDALPPLERNAMVEAMVMSPKIDKLMVDRLAELKRKQSG